MLYLDNIPDATREPISHAYLRNDLRNIIAGIAVSAEAGNRSPEFVAGFETALLAVAVAIGIERKPQRHTITIER